MKIKNTIEIKITITDLGKSKFETGLNIDGDANALMVAEHLVITGQAIKEQIEKAMLEKKNVLKIFFKL